MKIAELLKMESSGGNGLKPLGGCGDGLENETKLGILVFLEDWLDNPCCLVQYVALK